MQSSPLGSTTRVLRPRKHAEPVKKQPQASDKISKHVMREVDETISDKTAATRVQKIHIKQELKLEMRRLALLNK